MTETVGLDIEIRRIFQAPREKVFAAWTDHTLLEQWMCRDAASHDVKYTKLDLRPGGRYLITITTPEGNRYQGSGEYIEITPPKKLSFTWAWQRIPDAPEEWLQRTPSLVTVEFYDHGATTQLVFTHTGLNNEIIRGEHERGWHGCYDILEKVLRSA